MARLGAPTELAAEPGKGLDTKGAAKDVMSFAGDILHMMFADVAAS